MRGVAFTSCLLLLAGCAIFGGGRAPDPLAGWGGVWVGEYQGDTGGFGALEFEFRVDAAGTPAGIARFDRGMGMEQVILEALSISRDSLRTAMRFDGMLAEIRGARSEARARGTYIVRMADADQAVDSGTWEVTRRVAGN